MILREYVRNALTDCPITEAIQAHILNFYEDLEMPLGELYEVIDAIRDGSLEEVTEKMDGQNLTFTVLDGKLQMYSKGATWKRVARGGLTRDEVEIKYADRPTVRDAFLKSMDAIQAVIDADPENAARLFQNGQVVIESSIQMPGNPNTIVYDTPSIQFIQVVPLGPDVKEVDREAYNQFVRMARRVSQDPDQDVQMGLVPYLRLRKSLKKNDEFASMIKGKLDHLLSVSGMTASNTVGDLTVHLVKRKLDLLGVIPDQLLSKVARRIVTGDKSILTKREYVSQSSLRSWLDFQSLEKRRSDIVAEALIPLERIVQLIGVYTFRNLDFAIASNTYESGEYLRQFVRGVRKAFEEGRILSDPETLEKIRVALARIGDQEEYFEKAAEGIVFRWKGKSRKLTGLFTPINRLRGFFNYGPNPARIREGWQIQEGGLAFRRSDGSPLTVPIFLDQVKPTLDHFARHVLRPAGVKEYRPIGSTGKKRLSGDLDIAVQVPTSSDVKKFKRILLSRMRDILGADRVKLVGQNLSVAYPITGSSNKLVQVDVMLTYDLLGTAWLMSGRGEDRVKGVYRNLLLALVAKRMGEEMSSPSEAVKMTLSFPGGLTVRRNGKIVMSQVSDPSTILKILGIDAAPSEVSSFEGLVQVLKRSPRHVAFLRDFPTYISWALRSDPNGAQRAVDYLKSALSESTLRWFIRSSL